MIKNDGLEERFKEINFYLKQNKFDQAKKLAVNLLNSYPQNQKVHYFLANVNKVLEKELLKEIERSLKLVEPLWEQKRYLELLHYYRHYNHLLPDHEKILEGIQKLEELLEVSASKRASFFISESRERLIYLFKEKKYLEVLKGCHEFFRFERNDKIILSIYEKALKKFLKEKIKRGMRLFNGGSYVNALKYFELLFRLAPSEAKLKKMILKLQAILHKSEIAHKQELIDKQYVIIERLLKERDFDEALRTLRQVLLIDGGHKKTQRLIKKITQRLQSVIDLELISQMTLEQRVLRAEYKLKSEGIVRI